MALVPLQTSSPERRITQKEIIAGEERPKYLLIKQHQENSSTGKLIYNFEKNTKFDLSILLAIYHIRVYPDNLKHYSYIVNILQILFNIISGIVWFMFQLENLYCEQLIY